MKLKPGEAYCDGGSCVSYFGIREDEQPGGYISYNLNIRPWIQFV